MDIAQGEWHAGVVLLDFCVWWRQSLLLLCKNHDINIRCHIIINEHKFRSGIRHTYYIVWWAGESGSTDLRMNQVWLVGIGCACYDGSWVRGVVDYTDSCKLRCAGHSSCDAQTHIEPISAQTLHWFWVPLMLWQKQQLEVTLMVQSLPLHVNLGFWCTVGGAESGEFRSRWKEESCLKAWPGIGGGQLLIRPVNNL